MSVVVIRFEESNFVLVRKGQACYASKEPSLLLPLTGYKHNPRNRFGCEMCCTGDKNNEK